MKLLGEYRHNLDVKGRVNFPSKLRSRLGESFVIALAFEEDHLNVYSEAEWDQFSEKVSRIPAQDRKKIELRFFASAAEVTPDDQGRIQIPAKLREVAGLQKELAIVGQRSVAQIWDAAAYDAIQASLKGESMEDLAEKYDLL